jgi:hypothetical protein
MEIMSNTGPRSNVAQEVQGVQAVLSENERQLSATFDFFPEPLNGQFNGAIHNRTGKKFTGFPVQ